MPYSTRNVDAKTRRVTLASLWFVFIVVGLPLWHRTTSLEQCPLPAKRIRHHQERSSAISEWPGGDDHLVVKYSRHYKLVFSLLHENASSSTPVGRDWDLDTLLERHFRSTLTLLAPLHNFTIESQVQYFSPLSVDLVERSNGSSTRVVREPDVKAFVNNAEWNLAAGTTLDPVLHFVLYVPSREHGPIEIDTPRGDPTTSFITPQRGGLVIYNPTATTTIESGRLEPSFATFARQFRLLVGLSHLAPSRRHVREGQDARRGFVEQKLDTLMMIRLEQATRDATLTLSNLLATTTERDGAPAANVSVSREVQSRVEKALDLLDTVAACSVVVSPSEARGSNDDSDGEVVYPDECSRVGNDRLGLSACPVAHRLGLAVAAQQLANEAYFDPTLLPLLYFPDEHKYAVYTPLFGPVSVPLVVGLIREWKLWRRERDDKKKELKKREEEEEEERRRNDTSNVEIS